MRYGLHRARPGWSPRRTSRCHPPISKLAPTPLIIAIKSMDGWHLSALADFDSLKSFDQDAPIKPDADGNYEIPVPGQTKPYV